uniref:Uncharacterized protein n=1 Tax=Timema poppense TaxID=170557 RepID=A0A7R9H4T3_TIMPO|nr:unnamed protein product [Timema poppensis]
MGSVYSEEEILSDCRVQSKPGTKCLVVKPHESGTDVLFIGSKTREERRLTATLRSCLFGKQYTSELTGDL